MKIICRESGDLILWVVISQTTSRRLSDQLMGGLGEMKKFRAISH